MFKDRQRQTQLDRKIQRSLEGMLYADFVNVPNPSDKKILIKYGVDENKIIVHPYGIFKDRVDQFDLAKSSDRLIDKRKKIVFVGTFDNRKGAVEFPRIITKILKAHSDIEFKLLGVLGMFPDEDSIYQYIGNEFRNRIQIYGQYSPEDLPMLLNDCSFGIFPSYLESFGFGVLEMMAMDLPVVGYDSPGINMLLLKELTVPPGKVEELIAVLSKLIANDVFAKECKVKCRLRVNDFIYDNQLNYSIQAYQKKLAQSQKDI
jgi:glycosyltransferase involved in cell wall biosynthesis